MVDEAVRYALLYILLGELPPLVRAIEGVHVAIGYLKHLREKVGFAEDVEWLLSSVDAKWLAEYLMSMEEVTSSVEATDRFKARVRLFTQLARKYASKLLSRRLARGACAQRVEGV